MIRLDITMTGKSYSPKSNWQTLGHDHKTFSDKADAMAWIKENYGKAKRVPMYVDTKKGKTLKVGYVIGFRASDWSHNPVEKWLQQDWIVFKEVKDLAL